MIYFPPKKKIDSSEDYLDLGTNFYDKRSNAKKNLDIWQSKYLDKEGSKTFYDNYKVFYKSKFEENKFYLLDFSKLDRLFEKGQIDFAARSDIQFIYRVEIVKTLNHFLFKFCIIFLHPYKL